MSQALNISSTVVLKVAESIEKRIRVFEKSRYGHNL